MQANFGTAVVAAFQTLMELTAAKASMVQFVFYGGYATMAVPAALFIRKYSYKSGILEMEIYIFGTRLVMIIDTPLGFDLDTALSRLATLPRQQEWETYMSVFQECSADATSADKWQPMERMFHLYE